MFILLFMVTNFCVSFTCARVEIWKQYKYINQAIENWQQWHNDFWCEGGTAIYMYIKLVRISEKDLF